jgi:hypothetical protein
MLHELRLKLALTYLFASIALNLLAVASIAYFAINGEWLQAIFILLARKELVSAMDRESERLLKTEVESS